MEKIAWFSAGVSSAVATKFALKEHRELEIKYIHIEDQHSDTLRFIKDCEIWFDKKIEVLQSDLKSVENVCFKTGFVNGPKGAACTRLLKKRIRAIYESENNEEYIYFWGMDYNEKDRADRIINTNPLQEHRFPLIDNNIDKKAAHGILKSAGVKRPKMYDLGYPNNNCIGCLKGGMGYWNQIRKDFPDTFDRRAKMERKLNRRILKQCFLDELSPDRGREQKIILEDCGLFCEILS